MSILRVSGHRVQSSDHYLVCQVYTWFKDSLAWFQPWHQPCLADNPALSGVAQEPCCKGFAQHEVESAVLHANPCAKDVSVDDIASPIKHGRLTSPSRFFVFAAQDG